LRALAVLPVVLFHAGFQTFSVGFVGVVVFFVISGHLITSRIYNEKLGGTFTLVNFYERRARRILPALYLVLATCLPLAYLLLLPQDLKKFSGSLASVILFISNHFFSNQSAYFDSAAELKPLLHTWSLAVEEQNYLLFPAFIIATWRLGTQWIFVFIAMLTAISLGLAQYLSAAKPTTAFFILPTRAWELLIGAMTVFYFVKTKSVKVSASQNQLGSMAGFTMLIFTIFSFDEHTPFPSFYALMPTIGTALIILFATADTWVGKLLSTRGFVGIGLISYSAYLWHQPLLAFARHKHIGAPSQLLLGLLAIAAFVLAYFSWNFVETPFRNKARFSRAYIFKLFLIGSAFFLAIGFWGNYTKGLPNRPHMEANKVFQNDITPYSYQQCRDKALTEGEKLNHCLLSTTGSINAALIGDSHADNKFHGLAQNSEDLNWMLIGNSSCPPLLGVDVVGIERTCRQKFEKIVGWLATQDAVKTVAISYWANYALPEPYAADHVRMKLNADSIQISSDKVHTQDRIALFDYGLNQTVRKLIQANKRVIILIDIPELPYFPIDCVKGRPNCIDSLSNVLARQATHRESLRKLKIDFPSVLIFDPMPLFCSEFTCTYKNGDSVLYRDSHHLTLEGSKQYGVLFSNWLTTVNVEFKQKLFVHGTTHAQPQHANTTHTNSQP
jgi:peptidoglycan/LPS O-acetylase OafA/YrhL